MRISLLPRSALRLLLAFVLALLPAVESAATGWSAPSVHVVRIGHPLWKPVDFHLFSAPVGTADSEYEEFGQTMAALLPPPNHLPHPQLGIGPGEPHAPPYNDELDDGVAAQGFREAVVFRTAEFSNGQGVWLVWMNVPAPGTKGSSPDYARGRIIPNTLFPIKVTGKNEHNGKPFSVLADFNVPPLDASLNPPFDVDGHSHFPIFIADNADFGPPEAKLPGFYRFEIVMIDQSGSGWRILAHFVLVP